MSAQASRLAKAGGNRALAVQGLQDEFDAGARGWSAAQKAAFTNPATRDAYVDRQINQSTKGKFSGVLGKIGKVVSTVAPYALPLIPGLGPVAAGLLSATAGKLSGKSLKSSLLQGAGSAAGSALLGGKGVKGLVGLPGKVSHFLTGPGAAATTAAQAATSGSGKGIIGRIGDFVGQHPLDAAQIALAGYGTLEGAKSAGQADALRTGSLNRLNTNPTVDLGLPPTDQFDPYAQVQPQNRARRMALASLAA
jgi:hypothetical protein